MKKIIYGAITIMLLVNIACINIVPPGSGTDAQSAPPVAYIDAILPATVSSGEPVTFSGHGTDADGTIVGYEWRSSLSGVLSTVAQFTTSSLSAGTHTIYFRVRDNQNLWSVEVSGSVEVTPKVAKPVINKFTAIPDSIVRGGSTELSWSVTGAKAIHIDNGVGSVTGVGSKMMYPSASTAYTLTASNEGGSVAATASVAVQEPAAAGNPVITFTANHLGGTSWQLNWNVLNATQIIIEPDIGPVSSTGNTVVTVPSGQTKMYTLKAVNNWGWAYWQVVLGSP